MKKPTQYIEALEILKELKNSNPSYTLGQHIASIVYEYGDVWSVSDKEFLFALQKYKSSLELDFHHSSSDINDIINDAMDLENILNDGEAE